MTVGSGVVGDAGEAVPSGSSGTVVAIWGGGAAFEVEFETPVSALATVRANAITAHHARQLR